MSWHLMAAATAVGIAMLYLLARRWSRSATQRAIERLGARVDSFKFTAKPYIAATLLRDDAIAAAVRAHAAEHGQGEAEVWRRVERYVDEIVPFFNILAYYKVGYTASRLLLNLFYKVSIDYARPGAFAALPADSIIIYLINHRSNADYVLVAYALAGEVSISYAVGEWARAWPLEYAFKSFGSYFVRRRYREALYHTVLERYVQLITRNGVTQGIFPEGGLSRDGHLRPAKVGLLDYALGVARDPAYRPRMYVVPVAVNYDRVLEDRSLLAELEARSGKARQPLAAQLWEVSRWVAWNAGRLISRRWSRYGRAAATIGEPMPLAPWFAAQEAAGGSLFEIPRHERLARVQGLCDDVMQRIGALIPVTPVTLACAAIQSLDADFIPRDRLLARMDEMRDVLVELNARVLRADREIGETFDRAYRMLRMRRVLARTGGGYSVLPRGRPLVSYYANSIAHLLGPFADGVRARDVLPAEVAAS